MTTQKTFICGLQRSGTNLLQALLPNAVSYAYPYWKHTIKYEGTDPDVDQVICVIKNPYTWAESILFRNPVDIHLMYYEHHLLESREWHKDNPDDFVGPYHIHLPRLCMIYYFFYTAWMAYNKTQLIHYESLLNDETVHMSVPENQNWDPVRAQDYATYQTHYLNHAQIQQITNSLGKEFFEKIGYPVKDSN